MKRQGAAMSGAQLVRRDFNETAEKWPKKSKGTESRQKY